MKGSFAGTVTRTGKGKTGSLSSGEAREISKPGAIEGIRDEKTPRKLRGNRQEKRFADVASPAWRLL